MQFKKLDFIRMDNGIKYRREHVKKCVFFLMYTSNKPVINLFRKNIKCVVSDLSLDVNYKIDVLKIKRISISVRCLL